MGRIREMLNPQSVALIGATEKEGTVGRAVFTNLLRGTNRQLYPVNPNRKTVFGATCFPSIGEVPLHVSLAVIIAPAHTVPAVVEECGKAGVAGAIILSAGFGEADPQGKILEREIIEIRRKYGLRIIGPNCLGVILPHIGLNTTFLTTDPKPGNIAIISRALGTISRQDVEIVLRKDATVESYRLKLESRRDPEFRTVLVLSPGAGGNDDVCMGLPPLNQILARRLLEGTEVYHILKDTDIGEQALINLEETLINFSNLVVDFAEIESLELVLSIWQADILAQDIKVILCGSCDDSSPYPHLVITPYPSRYITTWSLPNRTEVLLRPVRPEDEPMSREMYGTVSQETLRDRFFTAMKITRDLLIRSCNIDYDREIAILAEIKDGEKKRMIGGIRLIREPDSGRAQFAILVHDDYQKMGLGAKLFDIMIGIAQEKGLDEIYGSVLSDNEKMLALCRKFGFRVKFESYNVSRVSLSLKDPI